MDWFRLTWGRGFLLALTVAAAWLAWRWGFDSVAEVLPGVTIGILLVAFWWHWTVAFKPRP
jgi:hypothetical protein